MKKYFPLVIASLSLFAFVAQAAYNDVSLTTDARIRANGVTVEVTGSTASVQSITVGATNFTVSLISPDSKIKIKSTGRQQFTHSVAPQSGYVYSETCNNDESSLEFRNKHSQIEGQPNE